MSIIVQNPDPITYIVRRKYPGFPFEDIFEGRGSMSVVQRKAREEKQEKAEAYFAEIKAKSPQKIAELYEQEQEKERQEWKLKAELEEKRRFYHQPEANADFEHWSKAKQWTLDEAIALSFGKSPKVVNWKSISHLTTVSPFVAQYANIRDLAYRAMPWNEMFDPVLPGLFIAWARRLDIAFPKQLEEKVVARGGNVADWKSNFDALKKTCDDLVASKDDQYKKSMKIIDDYKSLLDKSKESNEQLVKKNHSLTIERDTLRQQLTTATGNTSTNKEKPLAHKAKESLLKLVLGMAIDGYGYKPDAARSPLAAELAGNLRTRGIYLDEDTIRKWLNEAKEAVEIPVDDAKA